MNGHLPPIILQTLLPGPIEGRRREARLELGGAADSERTSRGQTGSANVFQPRAKNRA